MGGGGGARGAHNVEKRKPVVKILHNAHAQKYVNLDLDRLKIANFMTECVQ